jgi:hypothetical protein
MAHARAALKGLLRAAPATSSGQLVRQARPVRKVLLEFKVPPDLSAVMVKLVPKVTLVQRVLQDQAASQERVGQRALQELKAQPAQPER